MRLLVRFCHHAQGEAHVPSAAPGEYEIEMPPPLSLSDLPPALAHTLQHIVSKLDMMTQVIGMVEERLSLNEDKMAGMEAKITELSKASVATSGTADSGQADVLDQ